MANRTEAGVNPTSGWSTRRVTASRSDGNRMKGVDRHARCLCRPVNSIAPVGLVTLTKGRETNQDTIDRPR